MMNPGYHFEKMRALLDDFEPGRERSLAQTKIDEAELWLTRCVPTREAIDRDQAAPVPEAAAHPFTAECDGFHAPDSAECNLPDGQFVPDYRALLVRACRELADSGSPGQNALGAELARDGGIEP